MKENTMFKKAGEDYILVNYPEYFGLEPLKCPIGNGDF
jgi:hypothetical protein